MTPTLDDLLGTARVVILPLRISVQGGFTREAMLFEGPNGWTEFSPFPASSDEESVTWLRAAIDFGWGPLHPQLRGSIAVNATLPVVGKDDVRSILDQYPGCRNVKVKVGGSAKSLDDDAARVKAAREYFGPSAKVWIDAGGAWKVDEAESAIHRLAEYDLEYVEQPCASLADCAAVRERIKSAGILVAVDASLGEASDPRSVARSDAADLLVIKAQPLGGVTASLDLIKAAGIPVVISGALDTSVGESMGVYLAASVPDLAFDSGVGSAALLKGDVTADPLTPRDGQVEVRRITPDPDLLTKYAAPDDRRGWWQERLRRCHDLLSDK